MYSAADLSPISSKASESLPRVGAPLLLTLSAFLSHFDKQSLIQSSLELFPKRSWMSFIVARPSPKAGPKSFHLRKEKEQCLKSPKTSSKSLVSKH